jgi:hypothetical protein
LASKEIALCAFLDIEGSYDNNSYESIIRSAHMRGLDPTICRWIEAMLRSRRIQANLVGEIMEVKATRGCPQGGLLSPLLWSLVVDDHLVKLNSRGYYAQAYADDIVIFINGKFPGTISYIVSSALKCLDEWCTGDGLSINPRKAIIIPFTRRRNLGDLANLTLSGVKIASCARQSSTWV